MPSTTALIKSYQEERERAFLKTTRLLHNTSDEKLRLLKLWISVNFPFSQS